MKGSRCTCHWVGSGHHKAGGVVCWIVDWSISIIPWRHRSCCCCISDGPRGLCVGSGHFFLCHRRAGLCAHGGRCQHMMPGNPHTAFLTPLQTGPVILRRAGDRSCKIKSAYSKWSCLQFGEETVPKSLLFLLVFGKKTNKWNWKWKRNFLNNRINSFLLIIWRHLIGITLCSCSNNTMWLAQSTLPKVCKSTLQNLWGHKPITIFENKRGAVPLCVTIP